MPSVNFKVVWPDGEQVTYYSPSTIIHQHLKAGSYSQEEFAERVRTSLHAASERVYERFGYYCSAASAEQEKIDRKLQFLREQKISGAVELTQL